ncbi:MAG TPA: hypothetical protein ENL18_02705, partial [Thermoplasmatales archaeon]|nr:hypothetical protein [Thermoplasmatales archaeon]
MRKAISVIAIILFFMGSVGASVIHDMEHHTGDKFRESKIRFSGMEVAEGNYASISFDGCSSIHRSGYPVMPYKSEVLTFPLGTKIDGIDVSTGDVNTMHLDRKIIPASEPVRADMSNTVAERKEGKIYLS